MNNQGLTNATMGSMPVSPGSDGARVSVVGGDRPPGPDLSANSRSGAGGRHPRPSRGFAAAYSPQAYDAASCAWAAFLDREDPALIILGAAWSCSRTGCEKSLPPRRVWCAGASRRVPHGRADRRGTLPGPARRGSRTSSGFSIYKSCGGPPAARSRPGTRMWPSECQRPSTPGLTPTTTPDGCAR